MNRSDVILSMHLKSSRLSELLAADRFYNRRVELSELSGLVTKLEELLGLLEDVFVNESCPAGCEDEDCEPGGTEFNHHCESSDTYWRYCSDPDCYSHSSSSVSRYVSGWAQVSRYTDDPFVTPHGTVFCDPYEHGYRHCDSCSEVVDEDNTFYDEDLDSDRSFCESCYEEQVSRMRQGEDTHVCRTCHTPNVHFDELSEQFLCDHKAREALATRRPVKVARALMVSAVAA